MVGLHVLSGTKSSKSVNPHGEVWADHNAAL